MAGGKKKEKGKKNGSTLTKKGHARRAKNKSESERKGITRKGETSFTE